MKTKLVLILMLGASFQACGMGEKVSSTPLSLASSSVAQEGAYITLLDNRCLETVVVAMLSVDQQSLESSCVALEGACAQALTSHTAEKQTYIVKNINSMTDSELIKLRQSIQEACNTVPVEHSNNDVEMNESCYESGSLVGHGRLRTRQLSRSGFIDVTYEAQDGEIEMKELSK